MNHFRLTEREESHIVRTKNLDYEPSPNGLGHELFYAMRRNKYSIAQIDVETGETDSYENLLERCVRTSLKLILHGVTESDIICLCSTNRLNHCVPIISSLFLGVKIVPLDPDLSIENTSYILKSVKPKFIFVSPGNVDYIKEALNKAHVISELVVFGKSDKHLQFSEFSAPIDDRGVHELKFRPVGLTSVKETAIIIFDVETSQTPKGVCLSHYSLMIQAINTISYFNFGEKVYLSNYSQEHVGGFMALMNFVNYHWVFLITTINCTILTGITRIISSENDPTTGWRLIDKYNIPVVMCTRHTAVQMSRVGKPEGITGKSLKLLITAAGRLTKQDMLDLRQLLPFCFITNVFGLVEACGPITMYSRTKPADIKDQYENPTSCGRLIPGISCKIADPLTNKILGPNQPGELRYKTHFMMNGYYNIESVNYFDTDGWLKTNYIAYYDEKQRFFVMNHLDDVFKCGTWHIVPLPIETVIKEHPAVKDAIVIGIPHQNPCEGELPMGIVTLKKGMRDRVTADDIRKFVDRVVSKKQRLRAGLKIVKEIPYSLLGIPRRSELRETIVRNMSFTEMCECCF